MFSGRPGSGFGGAFAGANAGPEDLRSGSGIRGFERSRTTADLSPVWSSGGTDRPASAGGQEHLEPTGTGKRSARPLQEDHLLEGRGGSTSGASVSGILPASSPADHSGHRHHRYGHPWGAGGTLLSRLLRPVLLPAVVYLLWPTAFVCTPARIQPRCVLPQPGRNPKDRQADPRVLAASQNHFAWGLWLLPQ